MPGYDHSWPAGGWGGDDCGEIASAAARCCLGRMRMRHAAAADAAPAPPSPPPNSNSRDRERARELVPPGRFIEVFMKVPLELCEQRDPKGLYKKARAGQLKGFTGARLAAALRWRVAESCNGGLLCPCAA